MVYWLAWLIPRRVRQRADPQAAARGADVTKRAVRRAISISSLVWMTNARTRERSEEI